MTSVKNLRDKLASHTRKIGTARAPHIPILPAAYRSFGAPDRLLAGFLRLVDLTWHDVFPRQQFADQHHQQCSGQTHDDFQMEAGQHGLFVQHLEIGAHRVAEGRVAHRHLARDETEQRPARSNDDGKSLHYFHQQRAAENHDRNADRQPQDQQGDAVAGGGHRNHDPKSATLSREDPNHLTSSTGTSTRCNTLLATDPSSMLAIEPGPRVPMTICSIFFSLAKCAIASAASPTLM